MTTIHFDRKPVMLGVRIQGHQDNSIECAAVSAMACMLVNSLRGEELDPQLSVLQDDGLLIIAALRTPRTEIMYEMLERGFKAMQESIPDKVTVI